MAELSPLLRSSSMPRIRRAAVVGVAAIGFVVPSHAADESKVNAATRQVERGAERIGDGDVGEGVEETARGIGNTVVEGAKFSGKKLEEAGEAAEPEARRAGRSIRDGAVAFGRSVKGFFSSLFRN